MRNERRLHMRAPIGQMATLQLDDQVASAIIVDLSSSGARVQYGRGSLQPGRPVTVDFELPDSTYTIEIDGEVVHHRDDDLGIAFRALTPRADQAIEGYVARTTFGRVPDAE